MLTFDAVLISLRRVLDGFAAGSWLELDALPTGAWPELGAFAKGERFDSDGCTAFINPNKIKLKKVLT